MLTLGRQTWLIFKVQATAFKALHTAPKTVVGDQLNVFRTKSNR